MTYQPKPQNVSFVFKQKVKPVFDHMTSVVFTLFGKSNNVLLAVVAGFIYNWYYIIHANNTFNVCVSLYNCIKYSFYMIIWCIHLNGKITH